MAFCCRIDGHSPEYMTLKQVKKQKSSTSTSTPGSLWNPIVIGADDEKKSNELELPGAMTDWSHQHCIDSICGVNKIDIYSDESMKASHMYRVIINLKGFDPILLGTIDCTQKSLTSVVPPFFKQCQNGTSATLVVYQVQPPLAYESAGKEFERFLEALEDQWRTQFMSLFKQGMKRKEVDENRTVSALHFQKAVGFLHDKCQGKELGNQFHEAFMKLTL